MKLISFNCDVYTSNAYVFTCLAVNDKAYDYYIAVDITASAYLMLLHDQYRRMKEIRRKYCESMHERATHETRSTI